MSLENGFDKLKYAALVEAVWEPVLVLDAELRVALASRSFLEAFGPPAGEVFGRRLADIDGGAWNIPALEALLATAPFGTEAGEVRAEIVIPRMGRRTLKLKVRRLEEADGAPLTILAVNDVTDSARMEWEAAQQRQWFATTLSSIGDAVIATDVQSRVTFINPAAAQITGWPAADALGRPLTDVFNVVNEDTRKPVESPVAQALRSGMAVGLANHSLLIARDGREHPIDDSAAPIRDACGEVLGVVLVFHDISERRATERIQARLVEIVESSDDAIVAKDLNGIITDWNKGAEILFGYSRQEAVGRSITLIIPADRQDEEKMVLSRIRAGARLEHFETVRQRKDGSLIDISLTVSPIRNRSGEIIGASKIARDISERKRTEARLQAHLASEQAMRQEAQNANRSKDLFLATLSHELRTPLNAIVGWTGLLRSPAATPEDLKEGLEVIERNTKAQMQLIEDVLDVSRIVSGKLALKMQPCEFEKIIRAAADAVRAAANAKGIALDLQLDPAASAGMADPVRMQQIVWNLLSNAVKFTPKGGRVSVVLDRMDSRTRITVRDTGLGIAPDFLPYVFERFRQADSSTRRRFGGLGLGLSIVKQLVESHGGTVHAQSAGENMGATFVIELPVPALKTTRVEESSRPAGNANPALDREAPRLAGLHLLVVDDDADARRLLSRVLSEAGAMVTVASGVDEAVAAFDRAPPHMLISDIAMPEKDGYDLIRCVRAKGIGAKTLPAIALTAFAQKEDVRTAMLAGFQVHIAKPVDPQDLLAVVASLAERTGGTMLSG